MSTALNRFTQWLWPRGATHEPPTASFPDFPSGFREPDTAAFSAAGSGRRARPRRVRGRGEEEARVDREFDAVIVPSDGGCLSGSESSDGPDWSVGWLEPLAPGLRSDSDPEDCYAVLVPCYRQGPPRREEPERGGPVPLRHPRRR